MAELTSGTNLTVIVLDEEEVTALGDLLASVRTPKKLIDLAVSILGADA